MNVTVEIRYISNGTKVMQRASFPVKGRKHEEIAFEWFKQIRREMPWGAELVKVLCNEEDLTELVKELDKAPLD